MAIVSYELLAMSFEQCFVTGEGKLAVPNSKLAAIFKNYLYLRAFFLHVLVADAT
jgi:hypothetical protein